MFKKDPSPCSECLVYAMCQKTCHEWVVYMNKNWSVRMRIDKYAQEILNRTKAGRRSTGPR
jgi:hypothetical protein